MKQFAFVGWRGLVGSVLLQRMIEEDDFRSLKPTFFSSQSGAVELPTVGGASTVLNSGDLTALADFPIIVSCQGSDYTQRTLPALRQRGWNGFWVDAASHMRLAPQSAIILDPVNHLAIEKSVASGIRNYIGGNCTVSLLLMALYGLLREDLIESVFCSTYQAVSGAGAAALREFMVQSAFVSDNCSALTNGADVIAAERHFSSLLTHPDCPVAALGAPIMANVIPWIDTAMTNGQTREEWKAGAEAEKILGRPFAIDSVCVRVGALRCHSQAVLLKMKKALPVGDVQALLANAHQWIKVVENTQEASRRELTPVAVAGRLEVVVGRIRHSTFGPDHVTLFTVGDQLLWGAAEPLRRVLYYLHDH